MNPSLTDRIQNHLTPEDAGYLALLLDEPPHAIEEAWSAVVQLLVQTGHHKAQTADGTEALYQWMSDYTDPIEFPQAGTFMRSDAFPDWVVENTTLASTFLGSGALDSMERIGEWAGLRPDSVGMLITAAVPGFLGELGRLVRAEDVPQTQFKAWLEHQEPTALPDDLALADSDEPEAPVASERLSEPVGFAAERPASFAEPTSPFVPEATDAPPRRKLIGSAMGILAIVVLLLLAFLLWQRLR
ncbi:MAG: hypothetical protein EOP52_09095 [Sphingobacteriales bacterium]|nr:MAG: hypothetical protein EOP52_09095 [Sphingobacteriales bacterium]